MAFEHKHWSKIIYTRFIGITFHLLPRLLSGSPLPCRGHTSTSLPKMSKQKVA